jgi:hypothetical protein
MSAHKREVWSPLADAALLPGRGCIGCFYLGAVEPAVGTACSERLYRAPACRSVVSWLTGHIDPTETDARWSAQSRNGIRGDFCNGRRLGGAAIIDISAETPVSVIFAVPSFYSVPAQ